MMRFWQVFRGCPGPGAPGGSTNQQDFLRKNNKKENNLQKTYLKTNQTNCAGKLSEKNDRRNAKRRNAKVEYMVECNQDKEPLDTLKHARWPTATCG